jgi:tRNA uridine 5-carboxymethylaminomethyl modification enzyme
MFTSRAEFRLHLRIDNADRRLTPYGRKLGLINDEAWAEYEQKQARMSALERLLTSGKVDPEKLRCAGFGDLPATAGLMWAQLLKRPEVTIEPILAALRDDLARDPLLAEFITDPVWNPMVLGAPSIADSSEGQNPQWVGKRETTPSVTRSTLRNEARAVETEIKFAGYLEQQKKSIERLKAAESVAIPDWLEYGVISGLSREMRETFDRIRPQTLGQASRIPGVTPAALTLVHVSIKLQGKQLDAKRRATA